MAYNIVAWIDAADLRKVSPGRGFLRRAAREHQVVKDGDAAVFVNGKVNRFRLVYMLKSMPVLVIMPRADSERLLTSVALEVAITLGNLARGLPREASVADVAKLMLRKKRSRRRQKGK